MSLYKYAPGPIENSYVFPTDKGWLYTISFTRRYEIFKALYSLTNNDLCFEIQFERSKADETTIRGRDEAVAKTLQAIFYNHIVANGHLPIYFYICDIVDGKAAGRSIIFTEWYEGMELDEWQLLNYTLKDPDDNNREYYLGFLINCTHPDYEVLPAEFESFLETDAVKGKSIFRH